MNCAKTKWKLSELKSVKNSSAGRSQAQQFYDVTIVNNGKP